MNNKLEKFLLILMLLFMLHCFHIAVIKSHRWHLLPKSVCEIARATSFHTDNLKNHPNLYHNLNNIWITQHYLQFEKKMAQYFVV